MMKRILAIDDVKKAVLHLEKESTAEEMEEAIRSFKDLFLSIHPESLKFMMDEYNSFIGVEDEEELKKMDKDESMALEAVSLMKHMKSLYDAAEKECPKWFAFVDFIAALNHQIQNLDIVLIETKSGYCVVKHFGMEVFCALTERVHE
jgi:hypothetical protein